MMTIKIRSPRYSVRDPVRGVAKSGCMYLIYHHVNRFLTPVVHERNEHIVNNVSI